MQPSLIGTSEQRARGLERAAIRETFEEAGILVGERTAETPRTRAPAWAKFFAHGVVPRLDVLDFVARAITPPGRSRRFDARFFMAQSDAIAHTLDAAENDELLSPAWLTLAEARALDLRMIIRMVLDESRLNDGADASRPVPFFRYLRGRRQFGHL